jgi:DNA mismatch repair ATPase MutL
VGTTVAVRGLFEPLPVRRREFERNVKRDYGRALSLVQAYALAATGVRITCSNQSGKGYVDNRVPGAGPYGAGVPTHTHTCVSVLV